MDLNDQALASADGNQTLSVDSDENATNEP